MTELTKLSPELEGNIAHLEKLVFVVRDSESRETVMAATRRAKSIKAQVIELFREAKDYANKAHKKICALEQLGTDRCDVIEREGKRAVTTWDDEQDAIREKERARLQAIEVERTRKEQERLIKRAEKLKSPERAESLMEEAASIVAPVVQVEEQEKNKGESTRKVWKARVIDAKKVPDVFKIVDEKALNKYAIATKGAVPVEGVKFYQESSLAITI